MFHIQECTPRFGVPGKSLHKRGVAVFAAMGTAHIRIDGIAAHRQGGFCHDIFCLHIPDQDADVEYVYDGLMVLGAELALETVDKVIAGDGIVESKEQSEYADDAELPVAPKIFKETCEINWNQPAKKVYDFVRGLSPYPGAWGNVVLNGKEMMLKVFKTQKTDKTTSLAPGELFAEKGHLYVCCADSLLEILYLQQSGKKRMSAKDFINGQRL